MYKSKSINKEIEAKITTRTKRTPTLLPLVVVIILGRTITNITSAG